MPHFNLHVWNFLFFVWHFKCNAIFFTKWHLRGNWTPLLWKLEFSFKNFLYIKVPEGIKRSVYPWKQHVFKFISQSTAPSSAYFSVSSCVFCYLSLTSLLLAVLSVITLVVHLFFLWCLCKTGFCLLVNVAFVLMLLFFPPLWFGGRREIWPVAGRTDRHHHHLASSPAELKIFWHRISPVCRNRVCRGYEAERRVSSYSAPSPTHPGSVQTLWTCVRFVSLLLNLSDIFPRHPVGTPPLLLLFLLLLPGRLPVAKSISATAKYTVRL